MEEVLVDDPLMQVSRGETLSLVHRLISVIREAVEEEKQLLKDIMVVISLESLQNVSEPRFKRNKIKPDGPDIEAPPPECSCFMALEENMGKSFRLVTAIGA